MKRIGALDGLRGLALLGILLVNVNFFNESLMTISLGGLPVEGPLNRTIEFLIDLFVETKFMLLFSFLFGYGAVLLYRRTQSEKKRFVPLFTRRMLALLLFGVLHGTLIWYGDILTTYALLGLLLLPFIRRSPKTILGWSIALTLLVPLLMTALTALGPGIGGDNGQSFGDASVSDTAQMIMQYQEADRRIYGTGTFAEILNKRIVDYQASFFNMILFFPQVLGAFLLGSYFAKKELLSRVPERKTFLIRLGSIGGALGLLLELSPLLFPSKGSYFDITAMFIGAPLLMLAYVCWFALAFQCSGNRLAFLCNPGRIGFSMYILQSVLCSLVFYSYGFGLFGSMTLWQTTAVALLIYAVQIGLSALWLRRFHIGPLEYVWRLLYRGKPRPRSANL
ncbi:DUF418 domain-containing protein [Paenibacillus sp. DYY-L-2]|uniref:DUF418 domain-containing protein n=1 Tax=Paenibacillus sp. DYY-L-2 TaxID=3447013 RepID=UPI003F5062D1